MALDYFIIQLVYLSWKWWTHISSMCTNCEKNPPQMWHIVSSNSALIPLFEDNCIETYLEDYLLICQDHFMDHWAPV